MRLPKGLQHSGMTSGRSRPTAPIRRRASILRFAPALAAGQIDGVLLYSRRTAMTLRDLAASEGLTESLGIPAYYVISDQVGALIQGIAPHIHVAVHPDEDSLLALLPSP